MICLLNMMIFQFAVNSLPEGIPGGYGRAAGRVQSRSPSDPVAREAKKGGRETREGKLTAGDVSGKCMELPYFWGDQDLLASYFDVNQGRVWPCLTPKSCGIGTSFTAETWDWWIQRWVCVKTGGIPHIITHTPLETCEFVVYSQLFPTFGQTWLKDEIWDPEGREAEEGWWGVATTKGSLLPLVSIHQQK